MEEKLRLQEENTEPAVKVRVLEASGKLSSIKSNKMAAPMLLSEEEEKTVDDDKIKTDDDDDQNKG